MSSRLEKFSIFMPNPSARTPTSAWQSVWSEYLYCWLALSIRDFYWHKTNTDAGLRHA